MPDNLVYYENKWTDELVQTGKQAARMFLTDKGQARRMLTNYHNGDGYHAQTVYHPDLALFVDSAFKYLDDGNWTGSHCEAIFSNAMKYLARYDRIWGLTAADDEAIRL